MTLYEQGRFHLGDPVANFIPEFAKLKVMIRDSSGEYREVDLKRPVTIKHLLTHTAGLTYSWLEESPVSDMYRQAGLMGDTDQSLEDLVADIARFPLAYQPGSKWHYSVSFDVAAGLIEVISGQPLGQYLQDTIFDPLGMVDTAFYVPPKEQHRLAKMYGLPDIVAAGMSLSKLIEAWTKGFNEEIDVSDTYPVSKSKTFARGGHGLFSTAWDYMRFAQMLLN